MKTYKVIVEIPARKDLLGILQYITDTLKEPIAAKRIYSSIKEQILQLKQMPLRHSIVQEPPYDEMGVRTLLVENYIAFYIVEEAKNKVHVLRILHNRREWQSILGQ